MELKESIEGLVLERCQYYLNQPLDARTKYGICATASACLSEMRLRGELPAGMDTSCGLLVANQDAKRVILWFSDALQLWMYGEIRVRPVEGHAEVLLARG